MYLDNRNCKYHKFAAFSLVSDHQGKFLYKFKQVVNTGFGNLAKTQGILFTQVLNSLILKVKDISIFLKKNCLLSICRENCSRSWIGLSSQFCV